MKSTRFFIENSTVRASITPRSNEAVKTISSTYIKRYAMSET
jgi:hypothetical protein